MEPAPGSRRLVALGVTGTAAGVFSGLFGVGGGAIMVPLLVLWLGFEHRRATGTSLAAIVVIAGVAAIIQGVYGNVDVRRGILIGLPAIVGVLAGTALQQRVPTDVLALAFSAFLVAVAIDLLVT